MGRCSHGRTDQETDGPMDKDLPFYNCAINESVTWRFSLWYCYFTYQPMGQWTERLINARIYPLAIDESQNTGFLNTYGMYMKGHNWWIKKLDKGILGAILTKYAMTFGTTFLVIETLMEKAFVKPWWLVTMRITPSFSLNSCLDITINQNPCQPRNHWTKLSELKLVIKWFLQNILSRIMTVTLVCFKVRKYHKVILL